MTVLEILELCRFRCGRKNCSRIWQLCELEEIPERRWEQACDIFARTKKMPAGMCPWCKEFCYEINEEEDLQKGEEAAAEGMDLAIDAAKRRTAWIFTAEMAALDLCASGRVFDSDDVWKVVERVHGHIDKKQHTKAMGAIFRHLSRKKLARKTGVTEKTTRPTSNARDLAKWIGSNGEEDDHDSEMA